MCAAEVAQGELRRVATFLAVLRAAAQRIALGVNFVPHTPSLARVVEMSALCAGLQAAYPELCGGEGAPGEAPSRDAALAMLAAARHGGAAAHVGATRAAAAVPWRSGGAWPGCAAPPPAYAEPCAGLHAAQRRGAGSAAPDATPGTGDVAARHRDARLEAAGRCATGDSCAVVQRPACQGAAARATSRHRSAGPALRAPVSPPCAPTACRGGPPRGGELAGRPRTCSTDAMRKLAMPVASAQGKAGWGQARSKPSAARSARTSLGHVAWGSLGWVVPARNGPKSAFSKALPRSEYPEVDVGPL